MFLSLLPAFFACTSDGEDTGVPSRPYSDCDPIAADTCAAPFPSSFWEAEDPSSPTGVRVALGPTTLPLTKRGYQPDPYAWNRLDGWSPLTPLLARFPNLDVSTLPGHTNIEASLASDSPLILVDLDTGERRPVWAELDVSGERLVGAESLMIRQVAPLANGHHYAVALRGLRDTSGAAIAPTEGFRALRDEVATDNWDIEGRRATYDRIFAALEAEGWRRDEVVLAWDFHVGSKEGITGRARFLRDDALAWAGDAGPPYTITEVNDEVSETIWREVKGTFQAPLYTDFDGSGSVLTRGADGMPYQNGETEVPFTIRIPRTAQTNPRALRLVQYGHGLLGGQGEVEGGYLGEVADRYGYVLFAVDWTGMKGEDASEIPVMIATEIDKFHMIAERTHQGFVEFTLAAVMMQGAMAADAALAVTDPESGASVPIVDPTEVWYYGNSQGAILGGAYVALSPVIERATLGVGGAPYSLLLSRSSDFTPFFSLFQAVYPNQRDISLWMVLMQSIWDSGESSGFANHMVSDGIEGAPTKQVLLQDALGDAQVTTLGAHVMARAYGASQPGEPVRAVYGVPTVPSGSVVNALAEYAHGAPPEPVENIPPDEEHDTHESTRRTVAAQEQMDTFFRTGTVVSYCDGACDPE